MTKEIPLTQNKVALVDDEDYEWLAQWRWHMAHSYGEKFYACRTARIGHECRIVYMHRLILDAPSDMQVDHRNDDGLDNRRENLRLATRSQNQHNSRSHRDHQFPYKGVTMQKGRRKYHAQIWTNGKKYHLGDYDRAVDAARAYNEAAIKLFGEFARLNEIPDESVETG